MSTTTTQEATREIEAQDRDFARMIVQKLENQLFTAECEWERAEDAGDAETSMIWQERIVTLTERIEAAR